MKKLIGILSVVILIMLLVSCSVFDNSGAPYIGENGNWWVDGTDTGVAAQGPQGPKGDKGENGIDGKDGVDGIDGIRGEAGTNGANGANGADGPQGPAGANGADGADGKDGVDGVDGVDGLTPYIGENGNWWIGDVDTGVAAQGPAGANGADGAQGIQGPQGPAGANGVDGVDGLTPFIGENGNWWIGEEDTGVAAAGKDGANGADGKDGLTPFIGENGNWWIGETDTGVVAQGDKGDKGEDGKDLTDCEDHTWQSWVLAVHTYNPVTGKATPGTTLNVCVNCGDAALVPTSHEFVATVYAPTCDQAGFTRYTCACGMAYDDEFVAPNGHDVPAFDEYNLDAAWVLDLNPGIVCECEWERTYTAYCTVCGYDVHAIGTALGHVYTNYVPAINDTSLTECEWRPVYVAECDVCSHAACTNTMYYPALGHDWAAWMIVTVPTVDVAGEIVRVCNRSGEIESMFLPALSEANYSYVDDAPTCTEDGTRTYTVTVDGQSFNFEVAIPATGHVLNADCAYTVTVVPTFDADGKVVITCACGDKLTYALPSLAYGRAYNIQPGNCGGVKDVYSFVVVADGADYGECIVSFEVACSEEHSDAPAKDDCTMVESDGTYYWVYKCDKCGNVIVAYYEYK